MNGTLTRTRSQPATMKSKGRTAGRLKILHVVSSLKVGGMEQLVVRIAAGQRQRGYEASILSLRPGDLAIDAENAGIPVRLLNSSGPLTRIGRAASVFLNHGVGIIHAHNATSLWYTRLGKKLTGSPVVITCHGRLREDARVGTEAEWKSTDAVVAVSNETAKGFDRPSLKNKLSVIYNGMDSPEPARSRGQVRAELGIDERPVVIIVARIDGMKGHDTLLRAAAVVKQHGRSITTLIVGNGVVEHEMKALARELGIESEVRFLGYRTDVTDLLAASDIFALPSRTEGLPISALEAMAQGLPVIATPVGGVPELVEDGRTGILIPVDDPKSLSEAIERLVGESLLRSSMGDAGRRRVAGQFSFDGMLDQYDALYHELALALR